MFTSLRGRVALVTGSTSGIGLATARRLAGHGCNVMLNGLGDAGHIERVRAELEKESGVRVLYDGADLSVAEQVADMVRRTESEFGRLDVLVNNGGVQHIAPVESFPLDRWRAIMDINLTAVFVATSTALPGMRARDFGRIVNVASVHGLVASVNKSAYVAAKHGLIGFTKAVALETAQSNITVNAVCPGWVRTDLIQKQIELRAGQTNVSVEAAARDLLREKQPSLQFVGVDQLADVIIFLASDAASQIRGVALPVDGAWTAQ
jgi:3-hydroxybutyrate dehydrogenase